MSSRETAFETDFRERAKNNDVPVADLIGFEVKSMENGRSTVVLSAGSQHANPMGTLHGGVLCDITDAAMGLAFASTLAPNESFTRIELKISFFRPVWPQNSKPKERLSRAVAPSATWNVALALTFALSAGDAFETPTWRRHPA